jgi:hypothetical protein
VLLAFPDSKLTSRSAEAFFIVLIVTQVALVLLIGGISLITIFALKDARVVGYLILILDMVKSVLLIGLAIWQTIRRRRIIDPVKRQQVKWIGWSLTGMTIFYAVGMLISAWSGKWIPVGIFIALLVFTYAFIITLLIAIVRYRLWDTRLFVNKALFYGAVSTVLTAIGLTGVYFLELFGKQSMESDPRLGVGFLMLFMAAVFTPIRGRVQAIVDHYLKPEEVDFSSTLVELSPGSNLMLSSQDILRILVNQSIEQLELSGAAVHLRQQDGQLVQMEPAVPELQAPPIRLDDRVRKRLEKGEVVVPPDGSPLSLYVSLVVKRASRPHFLGVLVFGSRNSGEGYSTPVLKSLKKLGCDAGTAFYVAQLREHLGQNMMDRLAAIEKGLSLLNKPQASETSPVQ